MSKVLAKKLLEKRAAAHEKGKAIIDTAEAEGRALTAEEETSFNAITAEMDSLRSQADRLTAFEEEQREAPAQRKQGHEQEQEPDAERPHEGKLSMRGFEHAAASSRRAKEKGLAARAC